MCKYCEHSGMNRPFYRNDEEENILISAWIVPKRAEIHIDYDYGMCGHTDVLDIKYCPFCGSKLQQESRYHVEADWIHPHKDSRGEYLDDLTYDQAEAVRKQWVKDNIHKNVTMSKSELPFQGEGGNYGNQNTNKSDKG